MLGKLNKDQYFEWAYNIEKFAHSKTKKALIEKKYANMGLEIEIKKLKYQIFNSSVQQARQVENDAQKDFEEFKEKLEKELGYKLENVVINPVTLEVTELTNEGE